MPNQIIKSMQKSFYYKKIFSIKVSNVFLRSHIVLYRAIYKCCRAVSFPPSFSQKAEKMKKKWAIRLPTAIRVNKGKTSSQCHSKTQNTHFFFYNFLF